MGFDLDLFDCRVPSKAKCRLCFKVIEDAVKIELHSLECHVCKNCCIDYFEKQNNCEFEFGEITWKSADESVLESIESLEIKCPNIIYGCKALIPLPTLSAHVQYCGWRPFQCRWDCGTVLSLQKLRLHEECCDFKVESTKPSISSRHTLKVDTYDERIDSSDLNEHVSDNVSQLQTCKASDENVCGGDESNQQLDVNNMNANEATVVEAVVHRDSDEDEAKHVQTLKGQQVFGAMYKKVNALEPRFVKIEQELEEMTSQHTEDIKKLYDYSYDLMQALQLQTEKDLEDLKTQINNKHQKRKHKINCSLKHCTIT